MRIVVIGAYGYTGKLICQELEKYSIQYSIAGRDEERMSDMCSNHKQIEEYYVADITKSNGIQVVLSNADLIINCAGPFTEESPLFLAKLSVSGKIYLDITGELGFVKMSREKFHSGAMRTNTLIVHSVAFESMLVDLALQLMAIDNTSEIKVYYKFDQKMVSPGTRITMKLSNYRSSYHIHDGRWTKMDVELKNERLKIDGEIFGAVPSPLPEIAFVYWNHQPKQMNTYVLLPWDEAKFIDSKSNYKTGSIPEILERMRRVKKPGPSTEIRSKQRCEIIIKSGDVNWRLHSADMYGLTAKCVLVLVDKIRHNSSMYGVLSPAQLLKGEELGVLHSLGVAVEKI